MLNKLNKSKGFTLIELMVVISIISLLSAIVLASVKEVRDRAKITAFRAHMNQFITALELYKTGTGKYPYEDTLSSPGNRYFHSMLDTNTETFSSGGVSLSAILSPVYIKALPRIPNQYSLNFTVWQYASNFGANPGQRFYSCDGISVPKFVIIVSPQYSIFTQAVSDWSSLYSSANGLPSTWSIVNPVGTKCYSPK